MPNVSKIDKALFRTIRTRTDLQANAQTHSSWLRKAFGDIGRIMFMLRMFEGRDSGSC